MIQTYFNAFQAMQICHFSDCPADSHPTLKEIVTFRLKKKGGSGIVRELLEDILNVDVIEILYSS